VGQRKMKEHLLSSCKTHPEEREDKIKNFTTVTQFSSAHALRRSDVSMEEEEQESWN